MTRPLKKRIQYQAEYRVVQGLSLATRVLPLNLLRRVGAGVGWAAYRMFGFRRRVAAENIKRAFDYADERSVTRVGQSAYMNLGRSLVECAALGHYDKRRLLEMVTVEGIENLKEAYRHGKGVILNSGHFGNWELLGAVAARCGFSVHATDTNHSNEHTHRFINEARRYQGIQVITDQSMRRIVRLLSRNHGVTYLADRDMGPDGIFVDFLGRPASTLRGPAVLALRFGCPILPGFIVRETNDHHRAIFEPPLWPDPSLSGDAALVDVTRRFTRILERYVRRYPDHYLWGHRRWKSVPAEGGTTSSV
ncbi:MAG: lysophospholipid acyltransferase family protein [bacterium]|nr:lysophospholipid acyltransferase family protein [bacterium]